MTNRVVPTVKGLMCQFYDSSTSNCINLTIMKAPYSPFISAKTEAIKNVHPRQTGGVNRPSHSANRTSFERFTGPQKTVTELPSVNDFVGLLTEALQVMEVCRHDFFRKDAYITSNTSSLQSLNFRQICSFLILSVICTRSSALLHERHNLNKTMIKKTKVIRSLVI